MQDLTATAVASMSKGCTWNQNVQALVKNAGLSTDFLEPHLGGLLVLLEAHAEKTA